MKRCKLLMAVCVLGFFGAASAGATTFTLRVGGDRELIEKLYKPIQADFEKKNGIKLELYSLDDPAFAWKDLEVNRIDVAASYADFNDWRLHSVGYKEDMVELNYIKSLKYQKIGETGFMWKSASDKSAGIEALYNHICRGDSENQISCN